MCFDQLAIIHLVKNTCALAYMTIISQTMLQQAPAWKLA